MKRLMIFLALLTLICPAIAAQSRVFPTSEDLKTFNTEHFRVIYQTPLESAVPMIAQYCEEAYVTLEQVFRWTPEGRIDVMFLDSIDTHNGWATTVPHKRMAIYAAGAEPSSSIYQPGNYLRRTVFHELAHVFVMDISNGYDAAMSGIFGRVLPFDIVSLILSLLTLPPGVLAPSWLLEGFSIWAETEFVPPGRGKSSYADMIFRCAVRDDELLPYKKWYLEIPHWPYGLASYLYGMKLIQYIHETQGRTDNPIGELAQAVSDCVVTNLRPAARKVTGHSFDHLAGLMLKREKEVQQDRLKVLAALPETVIPRLTSEEIQVFSPVYLDGKIYFLGREDERRSTLYRYEPDTRRTLKIDAARVTPSSGNLATRPGGRYIYYTRLEYQLEETMWYEIWRYDTWDDDDELIMDEGRYRSIGVSRDGKRMAAVGREGNLLALVEFDLDETTGALSRRELFVTSPLHCSFSAPAYSPEGNRLCWVEADADGYRLTVFDRQTRSAKIVLDAAHQILMPVWHPVKDTILFSSDETGVYNLYEVDPDSGNKPNALTHVTGGLFFPAPSVDGTEVAAVGFDGKGSHLTALTYDPGALAGKTLPSISPLWMGRSDTGYSSGDPTAAGVETSASNNEEPGETDGSQTDFGSVENAALVTPSLERSETEDYNSFTSLRFNFWSPWLTASADGVKTGAMASFSDPTDYQDLTLLAGIETEYDTPLGAFQYVYRGFYPKIKLYATSDQEYYNDLVVEENTENRFDYGEETGTFGVAASTLLGRFDWQLYLDGGYEYRLRNRIEDISDDYRGRTISTHPTRESEAGVWVKTTYFDGTAHHRSVSIEDGRMISLGAERSDEHLGGDLTRMRYLAEWNEYLSMPWKENHVVKFSASYGFSRGDKTAQGGFTVGGFSSPIADMMPGLPDQLQVRGYPSNFQVGKNAARASVSYRFPIHNFSVGSEGPIPVYTNQVFAEVFHDAGRTWDRTGSGDDLRWITSTGIEANISLQLMRFLRFAPGIGVVYIPDRARRRDEDDRVVAYLSIKAWIAF